MQTLLSYLIFLPSSMSIASKVKQIIAVYLRFRDICRYIYIYVRLSACALHKTVHALRKSYHVGPLCIVLWNTGCCSKHHFEESPF